MSFAVKEGFKIIPKYLYYFLIGYKWQGANKAVMGLTLNKATISKQKIKIIPLSEQQAIVEELDLLSGIIDKKNEQLKELDNLTQATFYDMFGDPVTNEKGWETGRMDKVAPVKKYVGEIPSVKNKFWLLNLDVIQSNTGEIIEMQYFDKSEIGNSITSFDETNVLYSKLRPYLNKVVIPKQKGYASSELLPLSPSPILLVREFFAHLLRSNSFVAYFTTKVAGAKMPRVTMSDFYSFEVILPPLSIQKDFAERVNIFEAQKSLISQSIQEVQTLLDATMDKYFG